MLYKCCEDAMRLVQRDDSSDGYIWECRKTGMNTHRIRSVQKNDLIKSVYVTKFGRQIQRIHSRQHEDIETPTMGAKPHVTWEGRGSLVVEISDRGWNIMSSSPVPLKTRRVVERWT
ncbi:hypothetical protein TNCV_3211611 [Trichonephila clavipes]|uniref:Uncharacterized protein n=1 Tax=Trichonephila clavipes TaxID=2585209 RepID=A0A8X6RYL1_TRICX|nr:hypothetical protein TNCV_3211611 [Trichonephila clavipes]